MGMPIYLDVRDERPDPDGDRGDVRLAALGRRARSRPTSPTARSAGSAAASSRSPTRTRTSARCSSGARSSASRPAATSTRARAARSTHPGSSRAGRSTEAAAILEAGGLRNFAVNAGGDIRLRGRRPPRADRWRVGIQHPLDLGSVAAVVEAHGSRRRDLRRLRRGDHVLDPHTRRAAARRPLGDGHRARPRDRRRICDCRVCDGRRGPGMDGAPSRLRGDDDPRHRAGADDRRLSLRIEGGGPEGPPPWDERGTSPRGASGCAWAWSARDWSGARSS